MGYRFSKVCFDAAIQGRAKTLTATLAFYRDSINCLMGFLRFSSPAFGQSFSGPFDDFQRHAVFIVTTA